MTLSHFSPRRARLWHRSDFRIPTWVTFSHPLILRARKPPEGGIFYARRMWDSNSRGALPPGGLVNRWFKPLTQSSLSFRLGLVPLPLTSLLRNIVNHYFVVTGWNLKQFRFHTQSSLSFRPVFKLSLVSEWWHYKLKWLRFQILAGRDIMWWIFAL